MLEEGSSAKEASPVSFFFHWDQVTNKDYLVQVPQSKTLTPTLKLSYFTYSMLGDIKNLTGQRPEQHGIVDHALSMGGLDQTIF